MQAMLTKFQCFDNVSGELVTMADGEVEVEAPQRKERRKENGRTKRRGQRHLMTMLAVKSCHFIRYHLLFSFLLVSYQYLALYI